MNVNPLGLNYYMKIHGSNDSIRWNNMVDGQMWPHKDGVELYATKVTTWNEFCCFNATPWDETSFYEMSYIERGLWMNAWKQNWILCMKMSNEFP
jgi:hypothetical protein